MDENAEKFPGWQCIPVTDFQDFVSKLETNARQTADDHHMFWFRGQSSAVWQLTPSFCRAFDQPCELKDGPRLEKAFRVEKEALRAFKSRAHLFVPAHLLEKVRTTPCWWALMQHFSAPTRMLDWTISPYIAAYFACQLDSEAPGVVWYFCSRDLTEGIEKKYGALPPFYTADAPTRYEDLLKNLAGSKDIVPLTFDYATNDRIVAQQGRFTMGTNPLQVHDCIGTNVNDAAGRFVIPAEQKRNFLLHLRAMNITGAALFPGTDGLGRSARENIWLGESDPRRAERGTIGKPRAGEASRG